MKGFRELGDAVFRAGTASGRRLAQLLKTGQITQYNSEQDDGLLQKGIGFSYKLRDTGQYSGTTNVDLIHLVSDTGAFTAVDKTYTDAGKCGVFKAAGGEIIVISGSASNNGVYTTVSATANTVVFAEAIVNEADAPMTTFKKREAISNNVVEDNNTGKMWLRYCSTKMGILGTGLMPYTGQEYDIYAWCAACNAAGVGGHSDWHIPNKKEAASIMDDEAPSSIPNATYFPSWPNTYLWCSTTVSTTVANAYRCNYNSGEIASIVKTTAYNVALVRG